MSNLLKGIEYTLPVVSSAVIAVVATIGQFITLRLWRKTNRPIVSAIVETHAGGNISVMYNLVVVNSGNRPATEIRLKTKEDILSYTHEQNSESNFMTSIYSCFHENAMIPLLLNGESTKNSFGFTKNPENKRGWIYGSSFPIQIVYKDLDGRKYRSKVNLVIRYSKAFAGTEWKASKASNVS